MTTLKIRNWDKWQSYRSDRCQPPWIKIHRRIMRDPNWVELTDAQRGQLVAIWLLAADRDGVVPASPKTIQKLCFMDSEPDLQVFVDKGFIEPDANVTPSCGQSDANVTTQTRLDKTRLDQTRLEHTSSSDDEREIQIAFSEWNGCAENLSLPKAERLTQGRKNKLRACLKENGLQGWRRALANLSQLPFCLGEGERGWRANLDFLLQPSSFQKVLEMAFGGGTGPPAQMSRLQRATFANIQEIANGKVKDSNRNGSGDIRSQAPRLVYAATPRSEDNAQNNHPEVDRPSDVAAREID